MSFSSILRSFDDGIIPLGKRVVNRLAISHQKALFDREARAIYGTPPIPCQNDGVIVLSMTCKSQLAMYLCSVKSFLKQLGRGRALVINDGTLGEDEKATLRHHLPGVEIVLISDIVYDGYPRGGTWERLVLISRLTADNYVIQLDSDTVTLGDIPEIRQQVNANLPFILAGEADALIIPSGEAPYRRGPHVLNELEYSFRQHPKRDHRRYVRGCSAFGGFPKGFPIASLLAEFNEWQHLTIPTRVEEWGTEQVASNYVLANLDGALVLPYDRYMNHWAEPMKSTERFVHFIGPFRYYRGVYRAHLKRALAMLDNGELPVTGGAAAQRQGQPYSKAAAG